MIEILVVCKNNHVCHDQAKLSYASDTFLVFGGRGFGELLVQF